MISNHAVKKKHSLIKQSMAATGGGKQNTEELTYEEEQILNIMCSTSIHGHPDIEESCINLLEDSEVRSNKKEFDFSYYLYLVIK